MGGPNSGRKPSHHKKTEQPHAHVIGIVEEIQKEEIKDTYNCGGCGGEVHQGNKHCPSCGKELLWP